MLQSLSADVIRIVIRVRSARVDFVCLQAFRLDKTVDPPLILEQPPLRMLASLILPMPGPRQFRMEVVGLGSLILVVIPCYRMRKCLGYLMQSS